MLWRATVQSDDASKPRGCSPTTSLPMAEKRPKLPGRVTSRSAAASPTCGTFVLLRHLLEREVRGVMQTVEIMDNETVVLGHH